MRLRLSAVFAVIGATMLCGCVATMGDLQKGAQDTYTSLKRAVTPQAVVDYDAAAKRGFDLAGKTIEAAKAKGHQVPFIDVAKISFRSQGGQAYVVETIRLIRFPVPQDVLEAQPAELKPMLDALSVRLAEWHKAEPIEVFVVSNTDAGADATVATLRTRLPGIKVSEATVANAQGYPGIEARMVSTQLTRVLQ
jgi:hypothetical protein